LPESGIGGHRRRACLECCMCGQRWWCHLWLHKHWLEVMPIDSICNTLQVRHRSRCQVAAASTSATVTCRCLLRPTSRESFSCKIHMAPQFIQAMCKTALVSISTPALLIPDTKRFLVEHVCRPQLLFTMSKAAAMVLAASSGGICFA